MLDNLDYDKFSPLLPENKQNLINKFVNERQGRSIHELNQGATLSELVSGLNKLGIWPHDYQYLT